MIAVDLEKVLLAVCQGCNEELSEDPCEPEDCRIRQKFEDLSATDAVRVIRCWECKWSHTPYTDGLEKIFPGGAFSCRMGRGLNQDPFGERLPNDDSIVSGDDFCSYGERKGDDEDES